MSDIPQVTPGVGPDPSALSLSHVAFVGWTERTGEAGVSRKGRPIRVESVDDFVRVFGGLPVTPLVLAVEQTVEAGGQVTDTTVSFAEQPPDLPARLLPHAVRHFFANGGDACTIVSVGTFDDALDAAVLREGIDALDQVDAPLLFALPDACLLPAAERGGVFDHALAHCASRRDRFAILDVPDAVPGGADEIRRITTGFRDRITRDWVHLRHGAAYYPYLRTSLPHGIDESRVTIASHVVREARGRGPSTDGPLTGSTLAALASSGSDSAAYAAIIRFLSTAGVTLPPSGAVAGAFVRNDAARGVWKAPANVQLQEVAAPAVAVTDALNDVLTSDPGSGKSINAIRAFPGKGSVIWGARTLAGNDAEYRYVPVRRLLMLVELSVRRALLDLVSEPNDAATWTRAARAAEEVLIELRAAGAFAGSTIDESFFVQTGKGRTMGEEDVREGRMVVHVGVAPLKPGEFAVLPIVVNMTPPSRGGTTTGRLPSTASPRRRSPGSKSRGDRR